MTDTTASATAQREPISHPAHAQPGLNEVVAKTVHYGPMPMIFEKDVPVTVRDGTVLYANVFRPPKDGRFPVVISADIYGKDTDLHGAGGDHAQAGAEHARAVRRVRLRGMGGARSGVLGPQMALPRASD